MIAQWAKDIYFSTAGCLSWVSYWYFKACGHRRWTAASRASESRLCLHLGSGRRYADLPGFVNIEAHPFYRKDIWLDIRLGLPFPDQSVDAVYCSHLLEHFFERQVIGILRECHRVLKDGAGIRAVTPHLGKAIEAYVRGDESFFSEFPDARRSLGGRFVNHMLCRDQHRLMFDFSFMEECLLAAGFSQTCECTPRQSLVFSTRELAQLEDETPATHYSLFTEAFRRRRD